MMAISEAEEALSSTLVAIVAGTRKIYTITNNLSYLR
jgi:hypothetical protein